MLKRADKFLPSAERNRRFAMTRFYLIRHATNDFVGKALVGRRPGVSLNDFGRVEAGCLAQRLAGERIQRIFSSPMERCLETAAPLATALSLRVETLDDLTEVDFGDWTGLEITGMDRLDAWKQWNTFRIGVRIPNGESISEIQARMVGAVERLRGQFPNARIALVSHGDPLRALVCFYLGMPLDFIPRLEIRPASVTVLEIDDWSARLVALNARWGTAELRL